MLTDKQSLRQGLLVSTDPPSLRMDGWMERGWMIANVVIYYTVVLYIVCCAVLGYIDNNLKTGSTRYDYGIN